MKLRCKWHTFSNAILFSMISWFSTICINFKVVYNTEHVQVSSLSQIKWLWGLMPDKHENAFPFCVSSSRPCQVFISDKMQIWFSCFHLNRECVHTIMWKSGFFLSRYKAKMLGFDIILYAVWILTRVCQALVRERVLPWYMGGRYER